MPEHVGKTAQAVTYTPTACTDTVVCNPNGDDAIKRAARKYNLPRWFLYAVVHRESSFDKCRINSSDGGQGLTQLTLAPHWGVTYPQNLSQPNQSNSDWYWAKNFQAYGAWVNMNDVTPLGTLTSPCGTSSTDAYNPDKNLDRYATVYAAPAYRAGFVNAASCTTGTNVERANCAAENLRKVAYYWKYGVWGPNWYPNDPNNYLSGGSNSQFTYDAYVNTYRPAVEAEDGYWFGPPCTPPYSANGCTAQPSPEYTSSATASSCVVAGSGTNAINASFTNTNNVAYDSNLDIETWDGTTKTAQSYASRTFTANSTQTLSWNWPVPSTVAEPAKSYTIKLGVFKSDWSANPHWNGNAGTITVAADASKNNFECANNHGWQYNPGGWITSANSSTAKAYSGQRSLAVGFSGTGNWGVWTQQNLPTAGKTVTYRVWVPSSSNTDRIQGYVKEGAANNWRWTNQLKMRAELTLDAWNTFTVTVPSDSAGVDSIGVQFASTATPSWTGTMYVDSVTWQ